MKDGTPCLFLDRDGVLNRERGEHTWRLEDVEILPGVVEGIGRMRRAGYRCIVISNQSGIGLGLYDHADVVRVHAHMREVLTRGGADLDDLFYCPHHPSKGRCLCRKPGSLMLERALARHGLSVRDSVMIGDRDRDVEAACAVGIRAVLVEPNRSLLDTLAAASLL